MSAPIRIRAYVVGFGDCLLLHLPDGATTRHVLIDFGRAPNDPGSVENFPAIARDIEAQCGGRLDLLVVTHEHLDHLEGFYRERAIFDRMTVDRVWMGLPSHPDYYTRFPKAQPQRRLRDELALFADRARRNGLTLHPAFRSLLDNNLTNADRLDYLRGLGRLPVAYLARGKAAAARTAFETITVEVLAPEPDVSVYYARNPRDRALLAAPAGARRAGGDTDWTFAAVPRAAADDFAGLSASDFARLRARIREDGVRAARFIDRAQNNTSLCLLITAAGKRLLLPGDAELESWAMIKSRCPAALAPVDFLKVAHHGSHNGTPPDLLDTLLPVSRRARAHVLVSTKRHVYGTKNPVPDPSLLTELGRRCRRLVTTDGAAGSWVELTL